MDNSANSPVSTTVNAAEPERAIVRRTRGARGGPITRMVSPSDIGELIKPFVFLDAVDARHGAGPGFGFHPHSGIATVTVVMAGSVWYEETGGRHGVLAAGDVEWMRAGGGVWHAGGLAGTEGMRGFQLWVALPPALENAPAESRYLSAAEVAYEWPARVILGRYGNARSVIDAPAGLNYLDVTLKAGERWFYVPPQGHRVAWAMVAQGQLRKPDTITQGELVVFAESEEIIGFEAQQDTRFLLGSAVKHAHALALGRYSVHTNEQALAAGESEIRRLGTALPGVPGQLP